MVSFSSFAAFAALAFLAPGAHGAEEGSSSKYPTGIPCKPCDGATAAERSMGDCTVEVRINFFASETGEFYKEKEAGPATSSSRPSCLTHYGTTIILQVTLKSRDVRESILPYT